MICVPSSTCLGLSCRILWQTVDISSTLGIDVYRCRHHRILSGSPTIALKLHEYHERISTECIIFYHLSMLNHMQRSFLEVFLITKIEAKESRPQIFNGIMQQYSCSGVSEARMMSENCTSRNQESENVADFWWFLEIMMWKWCELCKKLYVRKNLTQKLFLSSICQVAGCTCSQSEGFRSPISAADWWLPKLWALWVQALGKNTKSIRKCKR